MKMKKILAAIAACAMAASMLSLTVSAAGIEDDGADLDDTDTEVSDTVDDDVDVDDDADVDVDDDADVDADDDADVDVDVDDDAAADDTTADENPGTGNSPIALAVIPVALAAAAVVAKKASK